MKSDENRRVYSERWGRSRRLVQMRRHLWRELVSFIDGEVLEIGPGLRPTALAADAHFLEISPEAVAVLNRRGGKAQEFAGGKLPYGDASFAAVLAFELLEHIEDDQALMREIARVLAPGALFIGSTPLHQRYWTRIDDTSAHVRRYEPDELESKLSSAGLTIERYSPRYGGRNRKLADFGVDVMERLPQTVFSALQNAAFPMHAWYQGNFKEITWQTGVDQLSHRATGLTFIARKIGE